VQDGVAQTSACSGIEERNGADVSSVPLRDRAAGGADPDESVGAAGERDLGVDPERVRLEDVEHLAAMISRPVIDLVSEVELGVEERAEEQQPIGSWLSNAGVQQDASWPVQARMLGCSNAAPGWSSSMVPDGLSESTRKLLTARVIAVLTANFRSL